MKIINEPVKKRKNKYPVSELVRVGDLFFIPCKKEDTQRIRKIMITSAYQYRKYTNQWHRRYTTIQGERDGQWGVALQRIEDREVGEKKRKSRTINPYQL